MAGHEYKAKDKIVKKMTRNGLVEENLHSGERKNISYRIADSPDAGCQTTGRASEASGNSSHRRNRRSRAAFHSPQTQEMATVSEPAARIEPLVEVSGTSDVSKASGSKPHRKENLPNAAVLHEPAHSTDYGMPVPRSVSNPASQLLPEQKRHSVQTYAESQTAREPSTRHTADMSEPAQPAEQSAQQPMPESAGQAAIQNVAETATENSRLEFSPHHSLYPVASHGHDADAFILATAENRMKRKKRQVQKAAGRQSIDAENPDADSGSSPKGLQESSASRDEKQSAKKLRLSHEPSGQQEKPEGAVKKNRLSFDDEAENGMVRGAGMSLTKRAAKAAATEASVFVHGKIHQVEQENAGVEGAHKSELVGEAVLQKAGGEINRRFRNRSSRQRKKETDSGKRSRLKFKGGEGGQTADKTAEALPAKRSGKSPSETGRDKKVLILRFWQKKQYKEAYAAAQSGSAAGRVAENGAAKAIEGAGTKAKRIAQEVFQRNRGLLIGVAVFGIMFLLIAVSFSSCTAMFQGTGNTFIGTTYPSTDEDIHATENAYAALETALNSQINNMESTHPGYDEYRYQVDEISHNPYQLISYLTVLYEEFTYGQVSGMLQDLFSRQYTLNVWEEVEIRTRTETRTGTTTYTDPETGESYEEEYEYEVEVEYEYYILNISLVNHGFDTVARSDLDSDQEDLYGLYCTTYGNRSYLFDTDTLSSYAGGSASGGFGYEIPAESLTDEKFARMIAEAEKFLGYPYVWGGSSPSTSFDCSGFVSWVINNCGNGWNVGRQTANGLRSYCAYVSSENAQPGDLIFFQGTYNTSGASHVGIYVGNGMMIHCGNPIQYTSINTSYWQEHFLAFGRIQ